MDYATGILACCALSRIRTCHLMIRSSMQSGHLGLYWLLRSSAEPLPNVLDR